MRMAIVKLIKSIVIASLFAFVLYFILAFTLAALFEDNPNKDLYISCCIVLIYDLSRGSVAGYRIKSFPCAFAQRRYRRC